MVRRRFDRSFAALGVGFLLGACSLAHASDSGPETPAESTTATVRAAIATTWHDHIDAATRKDLIGVMAMYADDAVYDVPGSQDVRGRPAIEKMEAQGMSQADVLEATHTSHDVRVFGDVAYEIGTVSGPVRLRGQTAQTMTFHFMAMWQRQADGAWRVQYLVGKS